jgi:two-component system sensor histidine kinase CiaH
MTKTPASLKRSEALAINWLHRFRTDLFLRTQISVIGIFFLLCLVNITIIAVFLQKLHLDIAATVISILSNAIAEGPGVDSTTTTALVVEGVRDVSMLHITVVVGISLIATILLGYVAARVALGPTRNGLAAQKQFIGNIAHELRTPLSIIRANSEILLLQKGVRSDVHGLIESNVEELDRISGIINNLLTLNTFRNTRVMNFEVVDLSAVVQNSIEKLEKLAVGKGITLHSTLENALMIWGNKSGIAQIAMNLVKNAILFTKEKGSVTVSTFASSSFVTLEVRDSGVGIESGNIEKIFEPFYQVEPSRTQNQGSGGLGLAIVSELVKFHKGKISVQSIPNIGTLIRVDFPKNHPDMPEDTERSAGTKPNTEVSLDFSKN